jgi:tRNA dimethylallyltransferase
MGPTAAGKTDLAVHLASRFDLEVVSVDSAMVYRGLDIGTGKPTSEMLARCPHHLIDCRDPDEPYSAGEFVNDAQRAIEEIHARGKLPVLVGGTMLYFRALTQGLAKLPAADAGIRAAISLRASELGWPALHAQLAQLDPQAAARIQPQDAQRIQRALEVQQLTGRRLSELQRTAFPNPRLRCLKIAWSPTDRNVLYTNITKRFHNMMEQGFLEEVRRLFARGDLSPDLPALRAVGYRQLWAHCAGECTLEESISEGISTTRHLARRQLVWLRSDASLEWVDALDESASARVAQRIEQFYAEQTPY